MDRDQPIPEFADALRPLLGARVKVAHRGAKHNGPLGGYMAAYTTGILRSVAKTNIRVGDRLDGIWLSDIESVSIMNPEMHP